MTPIAPSQGTLIAGMTSVSDAYTKDLNMRFRNDAAMMSNEQTVKRIERKDSLTLLVIAIALVIAILLLVLLFP